MAVDDNLFENDDSSRAADSGGEDSKSSDATSAATGGLTEEGLQKMLAKTLGPAFGEIATALKTLDSRTRKDESGASDVVADFSASDKKLEEFLADPEAAIKKIVSATVKEQSDPVLNAIISGNQEDHMARVRAEIDDEFGDGVWDEHFAAPVGQMLSTFPAEFRAQRNGVNLAVDQIKGKLYSTLKPKAKEREEVKQKRDFQVLPPSRRPAPTSKLNEDEKLYLDSLEKFGIKETPEGYMKSKNQGNTLEDYLKGEGKEGFLNGTA